MAKQAALAAMQVKKSEVEVSGVAKYLQRQESCHNLAELQVHAKQAALAALAQSRLSNRQVQPWLPVSTASGQSAADK